MFVPRTNGFERLIQGGTGTLVLNFQAKNIALKGRLAEVGRSGLPAEVSALPAAPDAFTHDVSRLSYENNYDVARHQVEASYQNLLASSTMSLL